jgi:hypothetical protein
MRTSPSPSFGPRPNAGAVLLLAILAAVAPLLPRTACAYEEDTHYAWTYYLALHAGYTYRQAYQVASATFAIDMDPDTGPMGPHAQERALTSLTSPEEGLPHDTTASLWRTFHCFVPRVQEDPSLRPAGAGQRGPLNIFFWSITPGEISVRQDFIENPLPYIGWASDFGGDVATARGNYYALLHALAEMERNPGPSIHYAQDCYSHHEFTDVRGHFIAGHAPDWLGYKPQRAKPLTDVTLDILSGFRTEVLGEPAVSIDRARIDQVLEQVIAANDVRKFGVDPQTGEIDTATFVAHQWISPIRAGMAGDGDLDLGLPKLYPVVKVLRKAIKEDIEAGRLPETPGEEDLIPPIGWMQFPFDPDGRVLTHAVGDDPERVGGGLPFAMPFAGGIPVEPDTFPVEEIEFHLVEETEETPRSTVSEPGHGFGWWVAEVAVQYQLQGLTDLPFLHPIPVREECELSTGEHHIERLRRREDGTWTATATAYLTEDDLRAASSWTCSIHVHGLEPEEVEVPIFWEGHFDEDDEDDPDDDEADGGNGGGGPTLTDVRGRLTGARARAVAVKARVESACDRAEAGAREAKSRVRTLKKGLGEAEHELMGLESALGSLRDNMGEASDHASDAYRAAERAAEARSRVGPLALDACATAEQIRATTALDELDRLIDDVETKVQLAEMEHAAVVDEVDQAGDHARETRAFADELAAMRALLRGLNGTVPTLVAGSDGALGAVADARSVVAEGTRAAPDLEPVAAESAGLAAGAEAAFQADKSKESKAAIREIRRLASDVVSMDKKKTACIEKQTAALDKLEEQVTELQTTATDIAERLDTVRDAAEATHAAAELFPPSSESMVEDALACLDAAEGFYADKTSPEAQKAQLDCSWLPNGSPTWNRRKKEAECGCAGEFEWNNAHDACRVKSRIQVSRTTCTPPTQPEWNRSTEQVQCGCNWPHGWNPSFTVCSVEYGRCPGDARNIRLLVANGDEASLSMARITADGAIAAGCNPAPIRAALGSAGTTPPSGTGGPPSSGTSSTGNEPGCIPRNQRWECEWDVPMEGADYEMHCVCADGPAPDSRCPPLDLEQRWCAQ